MSDKNETFIELGNDICRLIEDLLAETHGVIICDQQVKIKVEETK